MLAPRLLAALDSSEKLFSPKNPCENQPGKLEGIKSVHSINTISSDTSLYTKLYRVEKYKCHLYIGENMIPPVEKRGTFRRLMKSRLCFHNENA